MIEELLGIFVHVAFPTIACVRLIDDTLVVMKAANDEQPSTVHFPIRMVEMDEFNYYCGNFEDD